MSKVSPGLCQLKIKDAGGGKTDAEGAWEGDECVLRKTVQSVQ